MKDIFIKLTTSGIPVYINLRNIVDVYIFDGKTSIQTVRGTYTVKETQEEVMQIINKEQQRWL
jgi:helix-turn-helix protein